MSLRRALLIGINQYHPVIGPLRGCLNDTYNTKAVLLERFSFMEQEILELYDSAATRRAILNGLVWLVDGTKNGDVLVVFYSGHGTRLPSAQDPSGKAEALVSFSPAWETLLANESDSSLLFLRENWELQFVRDKEIKGHFDSLDGGVNLTLIMDCCYSGDINKRPDWMPRFLKPPASIEAAIERDQLTYWASVQETALEASVEETKLSRQQLRRLYQKVFLGNRFDFVNTQENSILLAACSEHETAAERNFAGQREGAFTHHLAETLRDQEEVHTYDDLIQRLGERMRFVPQLPRLSCSEEYRHQKILEPL